MSLKYILRESADVFKLSYSLSLDKFPYLKERMQKNIPNLTIRESGDVAYAYLDGEDTAIFKYDMTRKVMASDYTYAELARLKANDVSGE